MVLDAPSRKTQGLLKGLAADQLDWVVLARRYLEDHLAADSNAKLRELVALNKSIRLACFSSAATRQLAIVAQASIL